MCFRFSCRVASIVGVTMAMLGASGNHPAYAQTPSTELFPAFDASLLDPATFAERIGNAPESPIEGDSPAARVGPQAVVWCQQSKPHWKGMTYGAGREAGPRHLRIGFTQAVPVGSVLVGGGGSLSVLKPDAEYPGDLADDSQWISAQRLVDVSVSDAEVQAGDYGLWVLPPGTVTRALRFSHTPTAGDRETAGKLAGVWLLPQRMGNVAPQALVQSRARDDVSMKIVDESHNGTWQAWENAEDGAPLPVSDEHPEIVTLTWPKSVTLGGVCLLWAGFAECEIDAFTGDDDSNVREASEESWVCVGRGRDLQSWYPSQLGPNWIVLDREVNTRAIRVRMTAPSTERHSHVVRKIKDGRRVWLGELMALSPIRESKIASLVLPEQSEEPPPIPIEFTLPEAGIVTLVIEDEEGRRVRNLLSETHFPAGENIAWWDGSDDLLRDPQAAAHGVYHIPSRPVAPGRYTVRGLWRKPLSLRYEFSIYNAGKPPWRTADNTGCWLTTHTPPTSMAFVPGDRTTDGKPLVFMGCYVAEGGHGLQWLREDGTKIGGQHWVGGHWTGAPTLAVDLGSHAEKEHLCYVGSVWEGELRLTAKTKSLGDQSVFQIQLGDDSRPKKPTDPRPDPLEGFEGGDRRFVLSGLAAHDGMLVCSMLRHNGLLFVDVPSGKRVGHLSVASPRGVTFDEQGRVLVLSGNQLLAFSSIKATQAETVIAEGLEDPRHIAIDAEGRYFISDRGSSHQVKIFSPAGKFIEAIGKAGSPAVGEYDPLHMNNPNGMAVDSQGRVWVAENDNYPRRVSVWSSGGDLERTFYGPTEYGGGGVLDSRDAEKFFYKGLEFSLDWKSGTDTLARVFARPDPLLDAHYGHFSPDWPLYPSRGNGRRYFTSCYTHTPTGGDNVAFLWLDTGKQTRLVAALGDAHAWPHLREQPEFRSVWPDGTQPEKSNPQPDKHATFLWMDLNADGKPQAAEIQMTRGQARGVTVTRELDFVVSRLSEDTAMFSPTRIDTKGVPRYDFAPVRLGPAGGRPPSSGGNQTLHYNDWTISTNATKPFSPHGLGGMYRGEPRWSYPSPWPGLHASHEAAVPDRPGMVVGHTRLLGDFIDSPVGPMFGINGNMGNMYLFTADGLFVSTLFHDIRLRPNWAAPVATRNMDVTDVSLHDENFWPSMTQTPDGKVYVVDGGRTSLVRVDGLDTLQRLPDQKINVTTADLDKARDWFARVELSRQQTLGTGILFVPIRTETPTVDGELDDWPVTSQWAMIDRRGTKANFNSNSRPYEVSGSLCIADDRLFAAWRTTEKDLLNNSGETPNALFKTGGCLDLMLQTDTDQRLLVTLVKGKMRAVLYRAKVPGTTDPVAFSSPWRTINIDVVEDVTSQVSFATDKAGNYEVSVPLATLHWAPDSGDIVRADIGVLRGSGGQTMQRVYWSNKATAITADVPSEAELTPKLWGQWKVK
ncbi:NHL repeat-containing protein [Rhodopirellula sallentina]|uniref:NHL repeat containing protein n=1 Tax=Rhodopirellula sallentina SM41 TaxID=1263870 RepID=M5UD97_9BACT|nr:NHL repeat containing protein [Rhodopirellula sallentina]EMI55826.1 NHL repeat containing protein [Rhodopirellula sallentina SM41]